MVSGQTIHYLLLGTLSTMTTQEILYRLVEPGSNFYPVEILVYYGLAAWFCVVSGPWGDALTRLAAWNAMCQLLLFLPVVQLPTIITGHMSYVDIGWPAGLVVLAINALMYAEGGSSIRTKLVGSALLLHGARMLGGALFLFFPYNWKEDLSRYQYAKTRWNEHTNSPSLWWLKQQHDTLMQAYANSVVLAAPIFLIATNPHPTLRPLEVVGFMCWLVSWTLENLSDLSKQSFEKEARQRGDIKTAVLGHGFYAGSKYWLWTKSRHPNYFFEWMCWNSFVVMALPSALDVAVDEEQPLVAKLGVFLVLFYTSRTFYDCLLYWTGAEPAESRSVERRPVFKDFQKTTNVFFPFDVPWFDHHRTSGWPHMKKARSD